MEEPLDDATVLLYRTEKRDGLDRAVEARAKTTFDVTTTQERDQRGRLLAEGETDEDGRFGVTIDGEEYDGEPFLLAVRVRDRLGREDVTPAEATITYLQPEWEKAETGPIARWSHCLSEKQWCAILEELDVWMVCGRVTVCDHRNDIPIADATVTVHDADIVQHDELGSSVTNADGWYSIYYTTSDFERVPAPFTPIELRPGPDLFFEVVADDGTVLVDESSDDGRQPGREDVDNCAHVDLCVDEEAEDREDDFEIPSVWTGIGTAFTIPDGDSLNDVDADGYAGSRKYALTGTIEMTGSTPRAIGDGDVEYRFLFSDTTASNEDDPIDATDFDGAVGDKNNQELFSSTKIGELVRPGWFSDDIVPVVATLKDVDDDGWLNVSDAIDRAFAKREEDGPIDRSAYKWNDEDPLVGIDTTELTTEGDVPDSAADAGDGLTASEAIDVERFAFRFEVREVADDGSTEELDGNGKTLNRVVINNNRTFQKLEFEPLEGAQCSPIEHDSSTPLNLAYTVHHPHLNSAKIQIRSADSGWTELDDDDTDLSFGGSGYTGSDLVSVGATHHNDELDVNDEITKRCAYIVQLSTSRRLHTGNGSRTGVSRIQIPFYAE